MKKLILFIGILFSFICPALADGKVDPCHYSTEGTDFWFGLMQNRSNYPDHYLEITVTSRIGAEITVTFGPEELLIGNYTVKADSSQTVSIDYRLIEASGSETIENKGIHLVSTNPVNVYALNYRTQSSDVAVIYPTESLGKEYFAMCYTPHPTNTIESNSEFLIVASVDNTTVKITPSVDTDKGKKAKATFSIQLKKGQSYQVQSLNSNISGQGDLTGSYILSDKPIAFYSGAKSTAIPYAGTSRDHLYEQIPPTSTWGRDFYIVPLKLRKSDTYRILAALDGTTVTVEGLNLTRTLNRGQFLEFDLTSSQACRIISTKKILLAQYCKSQGQDGPSGVGDPFMIILSPVSQKINDVTFVAYESALIKNIFYINIITLTSEVDSISLDGKKINSTFTPFPNQEYSYAQLAISKGTHRLENPNKKNGGFLAYVYGFGDHGLTESYGYGVGFNLDIQLELGGSFVITDTMVICRGTETLLDAGDYFDSYRWNTGETSSTIKASKEGWYSVNVSTITGCQKKDSLFISINDPKLNLGKDTSSCEPGTIVLDAGKDFETYKWQDESTKQTFTVYKTGDYTVTGTNEFGCQAMDTVHVEILMPILSFTPNYSKVNFDHPDITFLNQTAGALDFVWDFGDGSTSQETSPTHHYSNLGIYHIILQAVGKNGCTDKIETDVEVVALKFYIPNAFRPDSEITENRTFLPVLNEVDPEKYQFEVFNRLGSTVFETRNPETGWNGETPNGKAGEPGVYIWICRYADIQGYDHLQKGTVMLVR
ncbi:MAG TPA: PKD domain-containing protein [Prolixibacteraceae bacterium]